MSNDTDGGRGLTSAHTRTGASHTPSSTTSAPGKSTLTGIEPIMSADSFALPAADTKYTFRAVLLQKKEIPIGPLKGTATVRIEVSVKDKGNMRDGADLIREIGDSKPGTKPANDVDVSFGSAQNIFEHNRGDIEAKLTASVAKAGATLLKFGDETPRVLQGLSIKLEAKALDAALGASTDDAKDAFSLQLLTVALIVEGDVAKMIDPELAKRVELKVVGRIDVPLGPDIGKQLAKAAMAATDVKKAGKFEAKLAEAEKKLSRAESMSKVADADLDKMEPKRANAYRQARVDLKSLRGEVDKMRGMRGKFSALREKAVDQLEKAGAALDRVPGGRIAKKIGGKMLATALKKFLPVYNVISTAQDIYEAATFLSKLDWSAIGKKIMDGGEGGTAIGDGSTPDNPGTGAGSGPEGDSGPATADDFARDLAAREGEPTLHPAAQQVLDSLVAVDGNGGSLSKEDKETLDVVVPVDLTAEELTMMKRRRGQPGTDRQDTVEAVIAALQYVRPGGARMFGPQPAPVAQAPTTEPTKTPRATKITKRPPSATKRGSERSNIIDPIPELRRVVKIGPDGRAAAPKTISFDGTTASVTSISAAVLVAETDHVTVLVELTMTASFAAARFPDGAPAGPGRAVRLTFSMPFTTAPQS